jgi:hypothetical protein
MTDIPIVRGEYHLIENRLHFEPKVERTDPIAKAQAALIDQLSNICAPRVARYPSPDEFEDVADYILRMTRAFDRWHLAVGQEVAANASGNVDLKVFEGAFTAAAEGNSTHECDACAEAVREEHANYRDQRDYDRVQRYLGD